MIRRSYKQVLPELGQYPSAQLVGQNIRKGKRDHQAISSHLDCRKQEKTDGSITEEKNISLMMFWDCCALAWVTAPSKRYRQCLQAFRREESFKLGLSAHVVKVETDQHSALTGDSLWCSSNPFGHTSIRTREKCGKSTLQKPCFSQLSFLLGKLITKLVSICISLLSFLRISY